MALKPFTNKVALSAAEFLAGWAVTGLLDAWGFGLSAKVVVFVVSFFLILWNWIGDQNRIAIRSKLYDWRNTRPMMSFAVAALIGAILCPVLLWLITIRPPSAHSQTTVATATAPAVSALTLLVDYQVNRPIPDALALGEQFRVLEVRESKGLGIKLFIHTGPEKFPPWPGSYSHPSHLPHVTITNKSKETLQDIVLKFNGEFLDDNGGVVRSAREYAVSVPILSPNEKFEFVISNWSTTYGAYIRFPNTVTVRVQGESSAQTVPAIRSQLSDVDGLTRMSLSKRDINDPRP